MVGKPFESFKGWLYAVVTQDAVPATHPETYGLMGLLDELKRGEENSRRAKLFFRIVDMRRDLRQPFLLVTLAGLSPTEAAAACNFTVERTLDCIEKAFGRLARSKLFRGSKRDDEL